MIDPMNMFFSFLHNLGTPILSIKTKISLVGLSETSSATAEIDKGPHGASTLSLSSTIYFTYVKTHLLPCLYSTIMNRVLMRVQTTATYSPNLYFVFFKIF